MKNIQVGLAVLVVSIQASAMGSVPSISSLPVRVYCNVSARGVAGSFNAGLDPMQGTLVYELKKQRVGIAAETYDLEGDNSTGGYRAVRFEKSGTQTRIEATGTRYTRTATANSFDRVSFSLKDQMNAAGKHELTSLTIDGKDHQFQSCTPPVCTIEQD